MNLIVQKLSHELSPFKQVTPEFLLVDLVNELDTLAEDKGELLTRLPEKIRSLTASRRLNEMKL